MAQENKKKIQQKNQNQLGISIIEVIVAMALFSIIAVVGVVTITGSFTTNRLGEEQTRATAFSQAGLEAARSIKNQGWDTDFIATNCTGGCGVNSGGGSWVWSGVNNTSGPLTRQIVVQNVNRDVSGNIVTVGGTNDPDTKKVISTVTWNFSPTRSNQVQLSTYLSNFRKPIVPPVGDWTLPTQSDTLDGAGNDDGVKVHIQGDYAYLVRTTGNPRFLVINISDPANVTLTGSLALASSSPVDVFVSGNYAYVVGTQNTNEFNIINITNPAAPSLVGNFDVAGTADASGVYVVGTTAYVVKLNSGSQEFYILNVTNPASITLTGSLNLNGNSREVVVSGNYAYVASTDNAQELQVVNITNPAVPTLAGSLNVTSNDDAISIALFGTNVYLAHGANLRVINVATPATPTLTASLALGGTINDISLDAADSNRFLFTATANNAAEFRVVNITNPAAPIIAASVNIAGNNQLRGVSYSSTLDTVVAAGSSNTEELAVIVPN